jgi:hypothetical protein
MPSSVCTAFQDTESALPVEFDDHVIAILPVHYGGIYHLAPVLERKRMIV